MLCILVGLIAVPQIIYTWIDKTKSSEVNMSMYTIFNEDYTRMF